MSQLKISRYLSYILRHKPDAIDLKITVDGWVEVTELIEKMNSNSHEINISLLEEIVAKDDKQRYSISNDRKMIRANQGHSIDVDLKLDSVRPPEFLYHGTATRNLDSIVVHGLLKQKRHHVHMSEDEVTAKRVGSRYGNPIILVITSSIMADDGKIFYRSENNVWLTEMVLPNYIKFPNN